MKGNFDGTSRRVLTCTALAAALFGSALPARAQGLEEPFREPYLKALQGKVVAYLPVAMSFDLAQGWLAGIKRELEPLGVKIVVRDPNWSTNAGAQALTNLISEKPDVIIAHNPDVQTYAKLLQKAESSGIDVVQINMRSSYPRPSSSLRIGSRSAGDDRCRRLLQEQVQQLRSFRVNSRRRRAPIRSRASRTCWRSIPVSKWSRVRPPTGMRQRQRASLRRC